MIRHGFWADDAPGGRSEIGARERRQATQLVAALVARGDALKVRHWRRDPRATLVARGGYQWVAVEGAVELAGPDDHLDGFATEDLAGLLRAVFQAAGGTHDDWATFDRVMADERRVAVLVTPTRVYSNG